MRYGKKKLEALLNTLLSTLFKFGGNSNHMPYCYIAYCIKKPSIMQAKYCVKGLFGEV